VSLIWDILQDHRFFKNGDRVSDLQARVTRLESQITDLQDLLRKTLHALESHVRNDIDEDGVIGAPVRKMVGIPVIKRTVKRKKSKKPYFVPKKKT
jgi:hypothetical protein